MTKIIRAFGILGVFGLVFNVLTAIPTFEFADSFTLNTHSQNVPTPDEICGDGNCADIVDDVGDGEDARVGVLNSIIAIGGILTYIGVGFAVVALVIAGLLYIFNREQEGRTLLKLVFYGLIIIIFAYTAVSLLVAFFNAL
jgi:hypothetical protein